MHWMVWSLMANLCITTIEYLNRSMGFASFSRALMVTAPLILVAQLGLYKVWSQAPTILTAWAFFSVTNSLLRLASAKWLMGETVDWRHVGVVGLMFGCALLMKGMK